MMHPTVDRVSALYGQTQHKFTQHNLFGGRYLWLTFFRHFAQTQLEKA